MSGKTKEEIAFELVAKLKGVGVWGENNRTEILDMYAECLEATSGMRSVKGRAPIAFRTAEPTLVVQGSQAPQAAPQSAPVQQAHPAQQPRAATPPQAPVPPQPASPVHQQQQLVQQAYPQPRQA